MRNYGTECSSNVPKEIKDEKKNWDYGNMDAVREVATAGIRGKWQRAECVCEGDNGVVSTTTVDEVVLACECILMKRRIETSLDQKTDMNTKLAITTAAGRTMRCQATAAGDRVKVLTAQLSDTQWPPKKLANESSRTKANLCG